MKSAERRITISDRAMGIVKMHQMDNETIQQTIDRLLNQNPFYTSLPDRSSLYQD